MYSVLRRCAVGGPGRALGCSVWSRHVSRCRYVEGELGKALVVGGEFLNFFLFGFWFGFFCLFWFFLRAEKSKRNQSRDFSRATLLHCSLDFFWLQRRELSLVFHGKSLAPLRGVRHIAWSCEAVSALQKKRMDG